MQISKLDHIVLTVASVDISCKFYHEVLGMGIQTFGDGRKALTFGSQKINLHQKGKEIDPKAQVPTPGSSDLCFVTDTPIDDVEKELLGKNVVLIESKVERTGATVKILSIYFRDPDLNLIELSNYL